jgi:ABC-2 type transport system permease protein
MSAISFSLAELMVSGFDDFPMVIRRGDFDKLLIRPMDSFFQVLASEITLRRFGRLGQGVLALALAVTVTDLPITWTFSHWLLTLYFAFGGALFFSALFVIGATYCFWTVESLEVMNVLTYGGTEMSSYPMHIYQDWLRRFFTFIVPMAFVNYYPALYLLEKPDPMGLPTWVTWLSLPICGALFVGSMAFWHVGVRHYTSTGS